MTLFVFMEPFLKFNGLQESAIVMSFPGSASIFCSHFLDFSRDLYVYWARKAILEQGL